MKLHLLVIGIAAAAAGAMARADPLDGRVRAFRVSFPRDWTDFRLDPADRRRLAARVLASSGAGKTLIRLADEGNIETRRAAIWALQFSGIPYDDTLAKASTEPKLDDVALEAAVAAGPEGPAAQRIWADALASGRFERFPPNAVARMDPSLERSRSALRRGVASAETATRCAALRAITVAGATDNEILTAALAFSRQKSYPTRYRAAEYVAKCGLDHPRAFEALLYAVTHGAGEGAARALLQFRERAAEIERALLPVLSGSSTRTALAHPEERVRIAHLLYRLGLVSDEVVRVLSGAAWGHWHRNGVPIEPSLSMLKNSPACHEIVLRRIDRILPRLGLGADRYGARFAELLNQRRSVAVVLNALPSELLAREDVRAAVRRHSTSDDPAIALAARVALWRGQVDRAKLVAWTQDHTTDARAFLSSIEPVRRDEPHKLDRALVAMLLESSMLDRLSRFRPFRAQIRTRVEPLLSDPRRMFRSAKCLAKLGFMSPAIAAGLKSNLLHGSPSYAKAAMVACTAAGIDIVDAYTELLPSRRACLWLGLAGRASVSAGPKLAKLLIHKDCGLEALWALGEIRPRLDKEMSDRLVAIVEGQTPPG